MRSRQTGITFIGWVVLLIPVAILVFAGIKLAPLYMNQFKVARVMDQTADSNRGDETLSPQAVRGELERRFDIESVETPTPQDVVIEREGDNWIMIAQYDRETTLFGNISLLVHFNKRVVLQ
jgi:Domain of unknown function (DUF4845)